MLRFPLDVRCVSVPNRLALFPAECVRVRKRKTSALWRHLELQTQADDMRQSRKQSLDNSFVTLFLCCWDFCQTRKLLTILWKEFDLRFLNFFLFSISGFFAYLLPFCHPLVFGLLVLVVGHQSFQGHVTDRPLSPESLSPGELNQLLPPSLSQIFEHRRFRDSAGPCWAFRHAALHSSASQ